MTVQKVSLTTLTLLLSLTSATACAHTNTRTEPTAEHTTPQDTIVEINDLDSLRAMLLDQYKRDQELRTKYSETFTHTPHHSDKGYETPENGKELLEDLWTIDQESIELLKSMIDKFGWPSYDMIGKEASDAAWLLAQHADAQPDLQQRILKLMKPLVEQSQADSKLFAMLTDRVLMNKNEPQIFGTQFIMDNNGILRPVPVEDFEHIDERRASVGLGTIKEYAAYMASLDGAKADSIPLDEYPVYTFGDPEECESDDFHNHP